MSDYNSNENNYNTQPDMPMKWHKFLIYFGLWLGAIGGIGNGIMMLTGAHYTQQGGSPEMVYSRFPGLKTVDVLFAIIYIGVAIWAIYTRFQLAGYKAGAPGKLLALYIMSFAMGIIYAIVGASVIHVSVSTVLSGSSIIGSIVGTIVAVVINNIYYGKRAHLFVN